MVTKYIHYASSNDEEKAWTDKIINHFKAFAKKATTPDLQRKIDDYFFNNGKEIKYFFIFDSKKTKLLSDKINEEENELRKFELELLLHWLGYNEEDVKEYTEYMTREEFYSTVAYTVKESLSAPYEEISFIENKEKIDVIKTISRENNVQNSIESKDINAIFQSYVSILEETWISECYIIDPIKYKISLKYVSNKIIQELRSRRDTFESLSTFFHLKSFNTEKKEELCIKKDSHYFGYMVIDPNKIDKNIETRENQLGKLSGADIWKLIKKLSGIFYDKEDDITPVNIFNEEIFSELKGTETVPYLNLVNWINTFTCTEEKKTLLIEAIREAYPIIGITISGRKDHYKNGHKQPPFFEIWRNITKTEIWNFLKEYDFQKFFPWDPRFIEYERNYINTKCFLKEIKDLIWGPKNIVESKMKSDKKDQVEKFEFNETIEDMIDKTIKDRINNYSEVSIFWVSE
jgi:hypothetical protein